ncbi:hypothetical protein BT93_J0628 [Corymbia citriodora subsp. variegata]|nr:hypothetical protein BT93_J0628 [Corymbia citriodora subsp. variegata]
MLSGSRSFLLLFLSWGCRSSFDRMRSCETGLVISDQASFPSTVFKRALPFELHQSSLFLDA